MNRPPCARWHFLSLAIALTALQNFGAVAALAADASAGTGGRLFFTPERREQLERQRRSQRDTETVIEDDSLSVNGIVVRSSGKWTLWVNGRPIDERERSTAPAQPIPGQPGIASVRLGDNDRLGSTKVGDRVDRASGEQSGLLGDGRIRVGSRPPPR